MECGGKKKPFNDKNVSPNKRSERREGERDRERQRTREAEREREREREILSRGGASKLVTSHRANGC